MKNLFSSSHKSLISVLLHDFYFIKLPFFLFSPLFYPQELLLFFSRSVQKPGYSSLSFQYIHMVKPISFYTSRILPCIRPLFVNYGRSISGNISSYYPAFEPRPSLVISFDSIFNRVRIDNSILQVTRLRMITGRHFYPGLGSPSNGKIQGKPQDVTIYSLPLSSLPLPSVSNKNHKGRCANS